jgi:hypothetical protein
MLKIITPRRRMLLEKLIVAQQVKKSKGPKPCSKKPATGPYPQPTESNPHLHILFPSGLF